MDPLILLQLANNLLQIDNDINDGVVAVQARGGGGGGCCGERLQRRELFGWYECLMMKLEAEDPASFQNFVHMEPASHVP